MRFYQPLKCLKFSIKIKIKNQVRSNDKKKIDNVLENHAIDQFIKVDKKKDSQLERHNRETHSLILTLKIMLG